MRAGALRKRVTIQQVTRTKDGGGGNTESWSTYAKRWASVNPLSGNERFGSNVRIAEISHQFVMRYAAGVTPKMRISWDSRVFDIKQAVNVDERGKELLILATERV